MNEELIRQLAVLISIGMKWESYSVQFSCSSLPPKELFVRFFAKKLSDKPRELPAQITLQVDRCSNNHLYIAGSMQRQNQPDIIQAEIVWLPNLHIFRGHVLVNPPTGEDLLRQDIANFRKMTWTRKIWQRSKHPHNDHDHCAICFQTICETDNENFGIGCFSGGTWLCNQCFKKYIKIT